MGLLWGFHVSKDLIMVMIIIAFSEVVEKIQNKKLTQDTQQGLNKYYLLFYGYYYQANAIQILRKHLKS